MSIKPLLMVRGGRRGEHDTTETTASVNVRDLGLGTEVKSARDLWQHVDVAFRNGVYEAKVPPHGVLMLRVTGGRQM